MTGFVTDIDNGLKRSVEHLGAVASTLEETAEELGRSRLPARV